MRIIVSGSRSITDCYAVQKILKDLWENLIDIESIIHGGAKGVDLFADDWAKANNIPTKSFKPDYEKYVPRIAPLIRNQDMVNVADGLIAIWDGKSAGTLDTIKKAIKKPLTLIHVVVIK